MENLSPNAIALLVIFVLMLVGLAVTIFRDRKTYAGYDELSPESLRLSRKLKGEIFRDGADLVISGRHRGRPVIVRFSRSENTPGLNIQMSIAANFSLWVAAKRARSSAGRVLLSTGDARFDRQFDCTSNHPQEAGFFLQVETVRTGLRHLMRSQDTFFTVLPASMEVSELAIPEAGAAHHVLGHLDAMHGLASAATAREGDSHVVRDSISAGALLVRAAIAIGVITAIIVIVGTEHRPVVSAVGPTSAPGAPSAAGILPVDLPLIPQAGRYRAAAEADLDPAALNWLRGSGEVRAGRVPGNYSGNPGTLDVAYLLIGSDGKRRVLLLAGRANKLDSEYSQVGLIARIPRSSLDSIAWAGPRPSGAPDGDGLLILRDAADPGSALVVFLSSGRVVSGTPTDFQKISLQ